MPLHARVGRHTQDGGRHCQNAPDDQRTVINLLNRIPAAAGGAAGALTDRVVSGVCSDELYRAISRFEDKYFPGQRSGFLDPGGPMLKRMEELVAATVSGPINFITPVEEFGPTTGPTKIISKTTVIFVSGHLMNLGIVGDSNGVVKTVSATVPNALKVEDAGVAASGVHWFRLSQPLGNKITVQAKDGKANVIISFDMDVIQLPREPGLSDLTDFVVDPADPQHPDRISLSEYLPKNDADYIDTRMTDIIYNIYFLGGFKVVCSDMNSPIDVPKELVDLTLKNPVPVDAKVYDTLAQAREAIRRAPTKAKDATPIAYYRGAGGAVIAPTVFSPDTTPRIIATLYEARRLYADYVQRAMVGVAIGIVGGQAFRAILGRIFRAKPGQIEPPRGPPPPIVEPPAMTRLRNTAADLQNENPLRSAEILSSPKVYRHSLTVPPKYVGYARIEMEGSMRLSTGVNAHYGEGVYAWPAGTQDIGTYIDIEVPAGTGVESLEVNGENWVRMVPPEGNKLQVRIVGTNMPQAQIDAGRRMVK